MRKAPTFKQNAEIHERGKAQEKFNRDIYKILSNPKMKATTAYKNYMDAVEKLAASFAKEIVSDNPSISIYDETINTIGRILNPRNLKKSEDGGFASDIDWFKTSYLDIKNIKKYTGINKAVENELYTKLIGPDKKSLSSLQKATAVRKYISKALEENPSNPEAVAALNTIATAGILSTYISQYNKMVQKYNEMHENAQKALTEHDIKKYGKNPAEYSHNLMLNYIDPSTVKNMEQFYDIVKKTPSLLVNAGIEKDVISIKEREFIKDPGKATNESLLKYFKENNIDFSTEVYKDLTYVKNLYYSMNAANWDPKIVDAVTKLIDNGYASIVAKIFKNNKDLEIVFKYKEYEGESVASGNDTDKAEFKFSGILRNALNDLSNTEPELANEVLKTLRSEVDQFNYMYTKPRKNNRVVF